MLDFSEAPPEYARMKDFDSRIFASNRALSAFFSCLKIQKQQIESDEMTTLSILHIAFCDAVMMSFAKQESAKLSKGGVKHGPRTYFSEAFFGFLEFVRKLVPASELKSGPGRNYFNNEEREATVSYRDPVTGLPTLAVKPEWWINNICRNVVVFDAVLGVVRNPTEVGTDRFQLPVRDQRTYMV